MNKKFLKGLLTFCLMLSLSLVLVSCTYKDDDNKDLDSKNNQEDDDNNGSELVINSKGSVVSDIPVDQFEGPQKGEKIAIIDTNQGIIRVRLFDKQAPKAVENFITHSQNGYYNESIFHRVIDGFMIQAGIPKGSNSGVSIWGEEFEDEFSPDLGNYRGALSMANTGFEGTNGSQFFIVQAKTLPDGIIPDMRDNGFTEEVITKYEQLGGTPWLDNRHTVFGFVYEGMDVVDNIAGTEVNGEKPVNDMVINKITIEEYK